MASAVMSTSDLAAVRQAFYNRIARKNLTPLWEKLGKLVTQVPHSPLQAALWRFADIRSDVLEAGTLISTDEAERRVLVLENPALAGYSGITQTLYAGLQLVLPAEVARAHRHTQSALRLVLEGEGAYTAVEGERRTMRRGDFILTPRWTWHDHGNLGTQPVIWLDCLDIPLVRVLEASFLELGEEVSQHEARGEGDNLARYGHNMVPMGYEPGESEVPRLFVYPYTESRAALHGIAAGPIDPHWGHKLRFINPATGGSPLPTIGAYAQLLPSGFESRGYRSTDSGIFLCLEGEGDAEVQGQTFAFGANDVFVVPSWQELRLRARRAVVLFSFSDRPVQKVLGLWREQRSSV